MPRDISLSQHGHFRVGQRIAVFIGDPATQHSRGLQTHIDVLQFLRCGQRQHASFGALVSLIRIQKAGALHE